MIIDIGGFKKELVNMPESSAYFKKSESIFAKSLNGLMKVIFNHFYIIDDYSDNDSDNNYNDYDYDYDDSFTPVNWKNRIKVDDIYKKVGCPESIVNSSSNNIVDLITELQQAVEIYLTGIVFEYNPFLVINSNQIFKLDKIDTLGTTEEMDFNSFNTISADSLLKISKKIKGDDYFKTPFKKYNFKYIYEKNRNIRNKNMHSLNGCERFSIEYLVISFLSIYTVFFRNKSLPVDFYKMIIENEMDFISDSFGSGFNSFIVELSRLKMNNQKELCLKSKRRQGLIDFLKLVSKNTQVEEYEELLKYKRTEWPNYICPRCESTILSDYTEGGLIYGDDSVESCTYINPQLPFGSVVKSLIRSKEFSTCYICSFKIKESDMININRTSFECCENVIYEVKIRGIDNLKNSNVKIDNQLDPVFMCLSCGSHSREV